MAAASRIPVEAIDGLEEVVRRWIREEISRREASLAGVDLSDPDTNPRARSIAGFLLARARWARRKT